MRSLLVGLIAVVTLAGIYDYASQICRTHSCASYKNPSSSPLADDRWLKNKLTTGEAANSWGGREELHRCIERVV